MSSSLADDALVLGHRLSEWSGRGPMLEEDIALSNLALDLIGQARLLYAYAGEIEGKGRGEDDLAYLRDEHAFANVLLVEQPNGDFAATMVRQLLYAAFMHPYLQALQKSARCAARRDRRQGGEGDGLSRAPCRRVGDPARRRHRGEPRPRRRRAGRAVDVYGRAVRDGRGRAGAGGGRASPSTARRSGRPGTQPSTACSPRRRLQRPADRWMQSGGRSGRHSEHLGHLLAEMQVLHRAHPGATW